MENKQSSSLLLLLRGRGMQSLFVVWMTSRAGRGGSQEREEKR